MEIIDVVNDKNEVIGQVPRDDLYSGGHSHRIVHVLIFNDRGEMALQLRSKHIQFCPHHWVTVASGHVQSGETPEAAARREMMEEIGLDIPFESSFEAVYGPPQYPGLKKFSTVFTARYNGPFKIDPETVERVEFFRLEEINKMINQGEMMHPELIFLIKENKISNLAEFKH